MQSLGEISKKIFIKEMTGQDEIKSLKDQLMNTSTVLILIPPPPVTFFMLIFRVCLMLPFSLDIELRLTHTAGS